MSYLRIHSRLIMSQTSLSELRRVELHNDKMVLMMTDNHGNSSQSEFHCQTKEEAELLMKETHDALKQQTPQPSNQNDEIQQQAVPTVQPRTKQLIWGIDVGNGMPLHSLTSGNLVETLPRR